MSLPAIPAASYRLTQDSRPYLGASRNHIFTKLDKHQPRRSLNEHKLVMPINFKSSNAMVSQGTSPFGRQTQLSIILSNLLS